MPTEKPSYLEQAKRLRELLVGPPRLTVEDFATRIGAGHHSTVAPWLRGTSLPTAKFLIKIAQPASAGGFGVTPGWLLGIEGEPKFRTGQQRSDAQLEQELAEFVTRAILQSTPKGIMRDFAEELLRIGAASGREILDEAVIDRDRAINAAWRLVRDHREMDALVKLYKPAASAKAAKKSSASRKRS